MKRIAPLAIALVLIIPAVALAQSRSRTTRRGTTSSKTTKPSATDTAAVASVKTEGATRIATQIKNLTTFLYLLGGVAKDIEAIDASAKSGQASPTNDRNKAQLKQSFEDFRVGLDQLEIYFRSTPELQPYYVKLVGSASGAAGAEELAGQGHFRDAGRSLISVVGRLADVLVSMR
jgi:hypothetical protein